MIYILIIKVKEMATSEVRMELSSILTSLLPVNITFFFLLALQPPSGVAFYSPLSAGMSN